MTELFFLNPQLHFGVNVTVRNGRKWDTLVDKLPFQVVIKKTGDDAVLYQAEIVGKMILPCNEIPEDILLLEHDDNCTDSEGLVLAMKRAYGEDWQENSEVTVLFFRAQN